MRRRTAQQRSRFWADNGVFVYLGLVAVCWLLTFACAPARWELLLLLAGMIGPAVVVAALMHWRTR